jgi:hypothetical protein
MEGELRNITSSSFTKKDVINILDRIPNVVEEASELRDKELVNSPDLRKALRIVETFLQKYKRVCYGGMAINAHLPNNLKFYDFEKTLPDYDFFTSEPEYDMKTLKTMFHDAGYNEISDRMGMHEGTMKLFINYVAVADITFLPSWMVSILKKRAIHENGILYTDADFLRMNMYLELSRPRGEVERWEKVYKRLVLLNLAKPIHKSGCTHKKARRYKVLKPIHSLFLSYVAAHDLIFAGAELQRIYSNPKSSRVGYIVQSQSPVLAYSENPEHHIHTIQQLLHSEYPSFHLKLVKWPSVATGFPEMWGLQINGTLSMVCIDETFCISYNIVQLPKLGSLKIVSLDAAIHLFYMLTFLRGLEGIVPKSIHCFADSLVDISRTTRDKGTPGVYPLFVTQCQGHQESKATLIRQKVQRIASLKRKKQGVHKTLKQRHLDLL